MRSILIVDDQPRIRETYGQVLENDGYHVLAAANAEAANEILKNETVDLMLLDIRMPGVGGDVLFEINRTFHQNIPVIACSVYPLDDQRQMIPGADDYFDKAEGLRVLRRKIARLLGDTKDRKELVIIDDEQKIRILYTGILKRAGYQVKGFGDNQSALRYLRQPRARIDLLILDLAMPHIDGCHFFEMMKMRHPQARVLIASNYELDTQRFIVFDADDYFDKSEGNVALLEKVKRLVEPPKGKVE